MTVEQALTKVKEFEQEKQRLQAKKEEIKVKRAEIQEKLKEAEDEIGRLLVKQALGELSPEEEKQISSLEKEAERLRRELRAVGLACQELQRRLSEAEKIPNKVYLMLFDARRNQVLDLLQREIEAHLKLAVELGLRGKLICQALDWLKRWESALSADLEGVGLLPQKALQILGPILTSKRFDFSGIQFFDLETKTDKTFEEIWQNDSSISEPWEGKLSFIAQIPACITSGSPEDLRKCAWRFIREGLGLDLDENSKKEEQ